VQVFFPQSTRICGLRPASASRVSHLPGSGFRATHQREDSALDQLACAFGKTMAVTIGALSWML
jgi:hypothetical protein